MRGIDNSKRRLQDPHIRQQLFRNAGHIEQQIQISDAVGLYLMKDHGNSCRLFFFIEYRRDLTGNVFSFQNRDLLQILRPVLFGLVLLQLAGLRYQFFSFFRAQSVLVGRKLFPKLPVHPGGPSLFRFHHHNGSMRILQKISADQIFVIAGADLLL